MVEWVSDRKATFELFWKRYNCCTSTWDLIWVISDFMLSVYICRRNWKQSLQRILKLPCKRLMIHLNDTWLWIKFHLNVGWWYNDHISTLNQSSRVEINASKSRLSQCHIFVSQPHKQLCYALSSLKGFTCTKRHKSVLELNATVSWKWNEDANVVSKQRMHQLPGGHLSVFDVFMLKGMLAGSD